MATKTKAPVETETAVEIAAEAETVFGVSDIAEIIKVKFGKEVKTRDLRTLLRKLARDGRLNREIVAGNRERWTWTGPQDAEVETILEAYENGELEADKMEKLNALKERKAAQRAAKKAEQEAAQAAIAPSDDEEIEA